MPRIGGRAVFCGLILAAASVAATGQVLRCTEGMAALPDDRLQRSLDEIRQQHINLEFQADDRPCQHARETLAALAATVAVRRPLVLSGYDFVKILNGDQYFTVERLRSGRPEDLMKLGTALEKNRSRKLTVKANTSYEYFIDADVLVLMISSASGREANSQIFQQLQKAYATSARGDLGR